MKNPFQNLSVITFDRYTQIGEIALSLRSIIGKTIITLAIAVTILSIYLSFSGQKGAYCLPLIGLGAAFTLAIWRTHGIGLPMLPMLVVQHLIIYTLPLFSQKDMVSILQYPDELLTKAGVEICIFLGSLGAFWYFGMRLFHVSPPLANVLSELMREGTKHLSKLGFRLIFATSAILLLGLLGFDNLILALLPAGTQSIYTALVAAASSCGFFLLALNLNDPETPRSSRITFWLLLTFVSLASACGLLLSSAASFVFATMIGLIWSTGRIPMRFMIIVFSILSFLNLGKYEMRGKYWGEEGEIGKAITLAQVPEFYGDWITASYRTIFQPDSKVSDQSDITRGANSIPLSQRINNLQNILFVIDAVEGGGIPVLEGKTYSIIPPLLVPRILWPEKPRTHEGQVMLNVHFGRQDLSSTFKAYIAWGLLPEAYGNFGPIYGAVFLGFVLGLGCAWIENFTAKKPVMSVEGFCSFIVFLGIANSFEMVASVLLTSIFQSLLPIIVATFPFSRRIVVKRPDA